MIGGEAFVPSAIAPYPDLEASASTSIPAPDVDTTHDVNLPASIQADEKLVMAVAIWAGASRTISTPSGWTAEGTESSEGGFRRVSIFSKTASGSEGSTVTVTTSGTIGGLAALTYRFSDAGEVVAETVDGNSAAPNPPNLDRTTEAKRKWLAGTWAEPPFTGDPADYEDALQASATYGLRILSRDRKISAENPAAFALDATDANWIAFTIGVDPA